MGIRRRRRKLTTLMSRLDQRVRSVELKPFSLLTASEVAAAVEAGEAADRPDVLVSGAAPYEWTRVQDAYYYPKKLTGNNEDRVEIYLEADLDNLDVDGRLAVSGIHGTSTFDIDVDGENFTVLHIDAVDGGGVWTDRATWKHDPTQDQAAGVTITNTYSFRPETVGPVTWTTRQRLQTKRAVDSFEITGTTVTLTMNANHKFEVGDIFYTNILSDQASNDESRVASGIDGLFYITAITSNTIEYELVAGVDTPTGTVTPVADVYVYPVARRWAQTGSIWVDSSNNETYYWDGIRWVEFTPDTSVTQDDDPPSPPTGLTITSDILLPRNVVELTATWTPPTTSESGATLTDLAAHEIQWRTSILEQWKTERVPVNLGSTYTFDAGQFAKEQFYYFQIYSVDSGDNFSSTPATATHTTAGSSSVTNIGSVRPTPPDVDTYLGTFTITWDGQVENTSNVIQSSPPGVSTLYVHASTSPSFTPSDSTRVGTLGANANQKYVYAPDYYGRTFYFALEIEDLAGSGSLYSRIVTGTGAQSVDVQEIANIIAAANIVPGSIVETETLVALNVTGDVIKGNNIHGNLITANTLEADRIKAGAITAKLVDGDVITTNSSDSGSRIRLSSAGLEAYNGSTRTFFLNSTNGSILIGGYATTDSVNTVSSTANAASSTANAASSTANTASDTANAASSTASGIYTNIYYPGTTQIDGGIIRTGTVEAGAIVSDSVLAGTIKTAASGARIEIRGSAASNPGIVAFDGGTGNPFRLYSNGVFYIGNTFVDGNVTLSGGTIQTASTGKRVVIDDNQIKIWSTTSQQAGTIEGTSGSMFINSNFGARISMGGGVSLGGSSAYSLTASASGVILSVVASTTFAANLRRPSPTSALAVVSSDSRIKSNISSISDGLSIVENLRPVTFNSMVDEENELVSGFIAQEVQTIFPANTYTIVTETPGVVPNVEGVDADDFAENPLLSLNHVELIPYLTKAIQELSEKNSQLEARIATLEGN